jgi:hypothetical protein
VGEGTLTSSIFFVTTIARATANAIIAMCNNVIERKIKNKKKTLPIVILYYYYFLIPV